MTRKNKSRSPKAVAARQRRPPEPGPGATAFRPLLAPQSEATTQADNIIKILGEVRAQLEQDLRNMTVQIPRLLLVSDYIRVNAEGKAEKVSAPRYVT